VHAAANNHSRWGKDFTGKGFYPQWSASNPIHLVGHSLGGTTIRQLEYFLQKGEAAEINGHPAGVLPAMSPLFAGGKSGWIKSMHTISSPHNGTPLVSIMGTDLVEFLKDLMYAIAKAASLVPFLDDLVMDFDFEQFEWVRAPGEDFWQYFSRIMNSSMWKSSYTDLAHYDVSVKSAYELNQKTDYTYPGTYYVSHTTSRTSNCDPSNQCPHDMEVFLSITAGVIGKASQHANACLTGIKCTSANAWCHVASSTPVDFCWANSWESSDGLVPKRSAKSPEIGTNGYVAPASRSEAGYYSWGIWRWNFQPSKWYTTHHERDHLQVVGLDLQLFEDADDGAFRMIRDDIAWMDAH
jgi:triacylglycerol esterase/lipase EstA (alpha/beta hydrolase family)